nr:PEP-CTERM sorting domain-containing protein [uncultured Desulfobacter sp.]
MKKILGFVIGLFLIVGLTNSGYAATSWYIEMGGSTLGIDSFLSFAESPNAVIAGDSSGSTTDFDNYGVVTLATIGDYTLYGEYILSGTVTTSSTLPYDTVEFDAGGILTLYVDDGIYSSADTMIAELKLVDGEALLLNDNGYITLNYILDVLEDGYFYVAEDDTDMATITDPIYFLTTTNAKEVDSEYMDATLSDYLANNSVTFDSDADTLLASAGQVELNVVPVPSTLFLLGFGIVGLVGFRRKNS